MCKCLLYTIIPNVESLKRKIAGRDTELRGNTFENC